MRRMGDLELAILGVIAMLGLLGGLGLAAIGVLSLLAVKGGGGGGLFTLYALGVAVGEFVLAGVVLVPAALLLRALSIHGRSVAGRMPAGLLHRALTGVATGAVLLGWMLPAALTFGSGSAASLDVTFSTIAIGIGLVEAACVFAASGLLDRPLGVVMIAIPLLSLGLPLWASSGIAEQQARQAGQQARQAEYAAERAHMEERFAEILQGPTVEELAAQVGDVGDWRLLGGGVTPTQRGGKVLDRQEALSDLGGSPVRFALVAQCTADFDGGELLGATTIFGRREANGEPLDSRSLESPVVPCDGQLHLAVSEAVVLPEWDAATLAGAGRDWLLVMTFVVIQDAWPVRSPRSGLIYPESGERWLMFVAPEPVPSVEPLLTELAAHLAPLRAR
jgi:hypothetical protein